jgi:CRISPR-associated protein Cmr6
MAIPLLHATKSLLGDNASRCESRSLFADRFADPQASDKTTPSRKDWFNELISKSAWKQPPSHSWLPAGAETLRARLMSRLMVNLAGGVMENANLLFDRYGYPVIPGTAVKGCARRMALQTLHDWSGALASGESSDDDITLPCRADFSSPAHLLAAIAHIFGWVPEDWKTDKKNGHYKSDFAWACGVSDDLMQEARRFLPPHLTFAGTIAFLPATPNRDPRLELDVVTPHHTAYYEEKPGFEDAPDTEDPVPVYFPAIAPQKDGDHFTFPILPLQGERTTCPQVFGSSPPVRIARLWLAHGLELLGLGAKTNAGYGWFSTLDEQGRIAAPLGNFLPPATESQSFIKEWGDRALNSMSARGFIKSAADVLSDNELLAIFEHLAPKHLGNITGKNPFWLPFLQDPAGKSLIERLKAHLARPTS